MPLSKETKPNPLRSGCDCKSILKQRVAGLNVKFSFPLTGYLTKAKELSLPSSFRIAVAERKNSYPYKSYLCKVNLKLYYVFIFINYHSFKIIRFSFSLL